MNEKEVRITRIELILKFKNKIIQLLNLNKLCKLCFIYLFCKKPNFE